MTADRDALLDVLGAIDGYARGDRRLATLLGAASSARKYLDRTPAVEGDRARTTAPAVLEERLVREFSGVNLLPGSTLCLTERAARRMARIARDVFSAPEEGSPRDR